MFVETVLDYHSYMPMCEEEAAGVLQMVSSMDLCFPILRLSKLLVLRIRKGCQAEVIIYGEHTEHHQKFLFANPIFNCYIHTYLIDECSVISAMTHLLLSSFICDACRLL